MSFSGASLVTNPPDLSYLALNSGNHVVNTWFVETPTPSGESADLKWAAELQLASQLIKDATGVLIIAGAGTPSCPSFCSPSHVGIGVDSGLPDYRGPQGFWKGTRPLPPLPFCLTFNASLSKTGE